MRSVLSVASVLVLLGSGAACSSASQTNPWEGSGGTPAGGAPSSGSSSSGSTSSSGGTGSSSGGSTSSSSTSSSSSSGSATSSSGSGSSSGSTSGSSSGSSSGGDAGASSDPFAAARAQCVQIINQYRATLNVAPLTEAAASDESCVDGQAQADYTANVAHSAFGKCSEFAQDECPGWAGPPSAINTGCLAMMWQEGPPPAGQDNHWLNMSNAQYTRVACGFYQDPDKTWWATQDFW